MALYNSIGQGYAHFRSPDPRIAAAIISALGDASSIANIGAGTGSYEPRDRKVIAVEPSEVMIRQRPAAAAPCLQGSADALPLESDSVDAATAILTIHHWPDLERGFRELARIARRRVVLLTWVPDSAPFWLTQDYFPEILDRDRAIFPTSAILSETLERAIGPVRMTPLAIPHDCEDGMLCAYWRRPALYLAPERRAAMSSFSFIEAAPGIARLRADLENGRWNERNGHLMTQTEMDLGYRLVVCEVRKV